MSRAVVRRLYDVARSRGLNASFVLVVGDGPDAREFAQRLAANATFGIRVIGFLSDPGPEAKLPGLAQSAPAAPGALGPDFAALVAGGEPAVLGSVELLPTILHSTVVDEVVIAVPPEAVAFVEPIARLCEHIFGDAATTPREAETVAVSVAEPAAAEAVPVPTPGAVPEAPPIAPAAAPISARGSWLIATRSAASCNLAAVSVVSPRNNPERPLIT